MRRGDRQRGQEVAYCAVHYPADYSIIDGISNILSTSLSVRACKICENRKMINALIELIMKCIKCCKLLNQIKLSTMQFPYIGQ